MKTNLILASDSYKYSHPFLYDPKVQNTFFYVEPRGGEYDEVVFFGLQYYLKEYLSKPITQTDIDEAEAFLKLHGLPFYREGWEHILKAHSGYLPLRIRAVPEGTVVPTHNVLMTVESTDDKCFWLPGFIETLILKVWYPITVASRSYSIRKIIMDALNKSSDNPQAEIDFKLHSFGYRGVSSEESAGIGGSAETLCFKGSDTVRGIMFAREYYHCEMSSWSIPALEHSAVCSWGKDNEIGAFKNMLDTFAKPGALVACVSDTYDLWNCIDELWNKELKEQVINSGATIVIRPDSGIPHEVVLEALRRLDKGYGHTVNSKGYKVINNVRLIQGDGINEHSIVKILDTILEDGWSATNLAFGMGGGMLSQLDRDTCRFAMKLSAIKVNGEWIGVKKEPKTDLTKSSKAGRLDLISSLVPREEGKCLSYHMEYETVKLKGDQIAHPAWSAMKTVFENGKLLIDDTLDNIRKRTNP